MFSMFACNIENWEDLGSRLLIQSFNGHKGPMQLINPSVLRAGGAGPVAPVLAGPFFSYNNHSVSLSADVVSTSIKNRRGE